MSIYGVDVNGRAYRAATRGELAAKLRADGVASVAEQVEDGRGPSFQCVFARPRCGEVWRSPYGVQRRVTRVGGGTVDYDVTTGPCAGAIIHDETLAAWSSASLTFDAEATAREEARAVAKAMRALTETPGTTVLVHNAPVVHTTTEAALGRALTRAAEARFPRTDGAPIVFDETNGWSHTFAWQPDPSQPTTTLRGESARSACPRCHGPAYTGLLAVECLRPGGCKTVDERIGEPRLYSGVQINRAGETGWRATSDDVFGPPHPTRSGAIALWREAAIAAERSR
jgi:hypothetical protein